MDPFGLQDLLEKLKMPFKHLHVAGNDANFTLKAFLFLAAQSVKDPGTQLNPDQEEILKKIQAFGQAPIVNGISGRTPDEDFEW